MSYNLKIVEPENAEGQLKRTYDMLQEMFQTVPKIFVAQSIRPDLLELIATYVKAEPQKNSSPHMFQRLTPVPTEWTLTAPWS